MALVITGFTYGQGSFEHFRVETSGVVERANLKSIGLALMWIMFAYSGWNASTYVGSEVHHPVKKYPQVSDYWDILCNSYISVVEYTLCICCTPLRNERSDLHRRTHSQ